METLHIHTEKLTTKHFIWIAIIFTTLTFALLSYFNTQLPTISLLMIAISFGCILLFTATFFNPSTMSFTLTFMHCQFHSHYGGWSTTWHNIQHIGNVTLSSDGWHLPLPWIGIRLKSYDDFIRTICPRVASRLLLEQRILLVMELKHSAHPTHQLEDILFDDDPFITSSGEQFKGLQAMLANRMRYNRELLGFDFFIADDVLDRPVNDFIGLLRRYKAAA